MDIYKTKIKRIPGTDYSEVYPRALALYKLIASKTRRRPYVRSAYFGREKVFLDYFWIHLREKNMRDRLRRLRYYACAIDLIQYSRIKPVTTRNTDLHSEIYYRFSGINRNQELFFVQIKEYHKRGEKYLMSIFPAK